VSSNADKARLFVDAFNRRDPDAIRELITDDFVLIPIRAAVEDIVYEGQAGLTQWWADLAESWSELRIELTEIDEKSDAVLLVTGRVFGRSRESDVPIESPAWWVGTSRGDRLARLDTFMNHDDALRAIAGLT